MIGNPGTQLGLELLTPDPLALGLGLTGVALFVRRRIGWATFAFSLMVLTKEQYILVPAATAAFAFVEGGKRDAAVLAFTPGLVLAAWSSYVALTIGGLTSNNKAFSAAFVGLAEGVQTFSLITINERSLLVITYFTVAAAIAVTIVTRQRLLHYLAMPWLVMAPFLSHLVWETGSNAIRVLLPLWIVAMFGIDEWLVRVNTRRGLEMSVRE